MCVREWVRVCPDRLNVAPDFTWHQSEYGELVISLQASCYWLEPTATGTSSLHPPLTAPSPSSNPINTSFKKFIPFLIGSIYSILFTISHPFLSYSPYPLIYSFSASPHPFLTPSPHFLPLLSPFIIPLSPFPFCLCCFSSPRLLQASIP